MQLKTKKKKKTKTHSKYEKLVLPAVRGRGSSAWPSDEHRFGLSLDLYQLNIFFHTGKLKVYSCLKDLSISFSTISCFKRNIEPVRTERLQVCLDQICKGIACSLYNNRY